MVNLTQHSYSNLRREGDVLGHLVQINADAYTPVDSTLIPKGGVQAVEATPFDFRKPTAIGERIEESNEQLRFGRGYDHNWVLNGPAGTLRLDATIYEPTSRRTLDVLSNQPGLQFYSGNFLDGTFIGKRGTAYGRRDGFCMEPQHFPDSPNQPGFPSTVLHPGEIYRSTIVYRFRVQ